MNTSHSFGNDLLGGSVLPPFVVYFIYMAVGALMHFAWDIFTSTKAWSKDSDSLVLYTG